MEEEIKILEGVLQTKDYGLCELTDTFYKALENLLTRYKQLEEKELEDNSKTMLVKFEHEQDLQLCMEVLQKLLREE